MVILDESGSGTDYDYRWPEYVERFKTWIDYRVRTNDKNQTARLGFGMHRVYERDRIHVVVWLDKSPQVEFLSADDFETSGELLAEIKVPGKKNLRMCRFPKEPIPERYARFRTVGLPKRVHAKGVHTTWAVITTQEDHKTMIALAALRQMERDSQRS